MGILPEWALPYRKVDRIHGSTLAGPALTTTGTPTADITPWDDQDGVAVPTTVFGGAACLTSAVSIDPLDTDDLVIGLLCRRLANQTAFLFTNKTAGGLKLFQIYTVLNQPAYIFCQVAGDVTREQIIPVYIGEWSWINVVVKNGVSVQYRLNGALGGAALGAITGPFGEGAGVGVASLASGANKSTCEIARAFLLAGSGIADRWMADEAAITARVFGLTASAGSDLTFARASAGSMRRSTGRYHLVSQNMPRGSGQAGGLSFEPVAVTNKARACIASQWAVTGGLAITDVDDTAALVAAGIQDFRPDKKVVECENDSGSPQYLYCGDVTGSTAIHCLAAFVRCTAGSGVQLGFYDSTTTDWTTSGYDIQADYAITRSEKITPATAAQKLALLIPNGATARVAAVHLQVGSAMSQHAPVHILATGAGATARVAAVHLQVGSAMSQHAPVHILATGAGATAAAESTGGGLTLTTPGTKRNERRYTYRKRQIWLCAGQSNMRGTMAPATLPAAYSIPSATVQMYLRSPDEGNYESAAIENIKTGGSYVGPWLPFALDMVAMGRDMAVGVVCQGSTSLAVDWAPAGALSNKLIEVAGIMLAGATQPAEIAGLWWIQGEQDATDAGWAAAYEANLIAWIAAMRTAIKPDLRVVVVKVCDRFGYIHRATVRAAQVAVAAADPLVDIFDTDDLQPDAGAGHYSPSGVLEIGHRMALQESERYCRLRR